MDHPARSQNHTKSLSIIASECKLKFLNLESLTSVREVLWHDAVIVSKRLERVKILSLRGSILD